MFFFKKKRIPVKFNLRKLAGTDKKNQEKLRNIDMYNIWLNQRSVTYNYMVQLTD